MHLNFITIATRRLEESVVFYRDLAGLQIVKRLSPGNGEIVFMGNERGDTMIELVHFPDAEPASAQGLTLSFACPQDLEALREKATRMSCSPSPILDHPPKPRHFTLSDPNGIPVEFGG